MVLKCIANTDKVCFSTDVSLGVLISVTHPMTIWQTDLWSTIIVNYQWCEENHTDR
jgi:hypothetical protein